MKFNAKQTENIARVLGSIASAAAVGAAIGAFRPSQVTPLEEFSMVLASVILIASMIFILKDKP
jgi:hypothetical protein